MSYRPSADFKEILSESNVPTTADAFETALKAQVVEAGSTLSNDSVMSPFWSWVRAAVSTPCLWLINTLLVGYVMPNMFVATAERWALELKAWELNITLKDAVKMQGVITFTKTNRADAVTITQGDIIQTLPIDGVTYQVQVLEDSVIEAGQATGDILTEALESGAAYNLPAGYFNILPQALSGISSAVNAPNWITTLGANEESDEELALRCQNAFTTAGNWHIDDAYRSIIASVEGIRSDNIYFENTGHITPGSATAYILMAVGETPQSVLDTLNAHIIDAGYHGHGDILTCAAIPDSTHRLVAQVVLASNLTEAQIKVQCIEIENRIRAAFRETEAFESMTRASPNSRFSLSQLATEIHNNMALVESVTLINEGVIGEDIVSELTQPRIVALEVNDV